MKRNIWGVFHDGEIIKITGCVPGDLRLELEIGYLCAQFPEPGHSFTIELSNCTQMQFSEYDEPPSTSLAHIQERRPMVLYVTSEEPLVLDCAMGTLELEYSKMRVLLPSGREVSEQELTNACEQYWNAWQERANAAATGVKGELK